ncbi:MAG TPA: flagellar hook-associated protein FlgK [Syntrophorhabdaceae bacterium]|nr:flagellar hook-associated protein FlgK [Syntrophorhabdaceae bacterium]
MGLTAILNIARNALFAQQTALQVMSNNVANVNTKGYARQEAVLTEESVTMTDLGLLGNGVKVSSVMSYYDKFLEASVAKENNSLTEQKTYADYFSRLESILDENNTNLASNIDSFFSTWHDLSADPLSLTARINASTAGVNLSSGIRNLYSELESVQTEVDNNILKEVQNINNILTSIAALNGQIYTSGGAGGENSSFVNQRAQLLQELSGKLDIQYFEDADGGMTVMTSGGKALVDRESLYTLTAEKLNGSNFYSVTWNGNSANPVDITGTIHGGSIKGLIDLRDNYVGGFMDDVNNLAESIMNQVNDIHNTGYNMNGTTGIDFFKNLTQNFAAGFDISDEIKSDARNIAVTSLASNTSDNDIALAIADLGTASITIQGQATTYTDYTTSMASSAGSLSQNAQDLYEYHENLMNVVQKQRDSVSGVSIDEEMSNLIKYQYAYQAAARLINVADTMMNTLLEIGR